MGSYNLNKDKTGIYVYKLDTLNGRLKKFTTVKNILNPSYLSLSKNGKYLFACTETKTPNAGSVSSFEFKPKQKALSFINSQSSSGENPVYCATDKSGKWLINANYTAGSLAIRAVAEDGRLGPSLQSFSFSDSSIDSARQGSSHIHSSVFSPDYDYAFFPDLGADKIRCFRFVANGAQPLQEAVHPFAQSTLGSGPRHLRFHPNGNYAYNVEEMAGYITVYSYKQGVLSPLQRIAMHPQGIYSGYSGSDVHLSGDGRFLYASNRAEENNIAIFSVKADGTLQFVAYQSCFGKTPRAFAIDEKGKFVIVANQDTGNIVVFKRDAQTGELKKCSSRSKIKNASSVQIKEYPSL